MTPGATHAQQFAKDGFCLFSNVLDAEFCGQIAHDVISEYDRLVSAGWKFAAGGRYTGHLNFSPGLYGQELLDMLDSKGFLKIAEAVLGGPVALFGVVGNMNLPQSVAQDIHQDWAPPGESMVFNIGLVPTTRENGPTEIVPGSQGSRFTYTSLHLSGTRRKSLFWEPAAGDLIMRLGSVWHRGTENRSANPRPMLSVIVVPRDGEQAPPPKIPVSDRITFSANRFYGRAARARELASIYLAWPMHWLRLARGR